MRILFLNDCNLDYTTDPLYLGLSRILGNEQVVDYPYKASFHEWEPCPWYMKPRPGRPYSEDEILDELREKRFDFVCVGSFRENCRKELIALSRRIALPPLVFVDGSDDLSIYHDFVDKFPITLYFKREYFGGNGLKNSISLIKEFRWNSKLFSRTFPFPMSIVLDSLPSFDSEGRDIDVSFRGRASHPRRVQAVQILNGIGGIKFVGGVYGSPGDRKYKMVSGRLKRLWVKIFNNTEIETNAQRIRLEPTDYYRELASSKIALSIRGGGVATLRYFEIVAMGALLVSDPSQALIPNDFVNGEHAVFCRPDLRNLRQVIAHYLRNNEERELLTMRAREHLLKHHTCERRAEYFLNICRRTL